MKRERGRKKRRMMLPHIKITLLHMMKRERRRNKMRMVLPHFKRKLIDMKRGRRKKRMILPPHIPADVCGEIFLRLPAKSLIRFWTVCKSWRAFIDKPHFVKAHTDKQQHSSSNTLLVLNSTGPPLYSFDLDALDFNKAHQTISVTPIDLNPIRLSRIPYFPVAECNGLFLVQGELFWEIWNPLTDERLELPPVGNLASQEVVDWGFGYDPGSDDYKAVVIHESRPGQPGVNYEYPTYVYSLKSDSWRKAMNCPYDFWVCTKFIGVYLSGALSWMPGDDKVIALDLGTVKYRQWQLPPFQESHGKNDLVLGDNYLIVLDGRLMVSDFGMDDYYFQHYDVWVMEDYGVEDSWIKLLSMTSDLCGSDFILKGGLCPVACLKNKTQIFMQNNFGFYLFDIKSLSVKVVRIDGLTRKTNAQLFHGSIFRLHDNCGVSGRVKTQITSMTKISDHSKLAFMSFRISM